MRKVVAVVGRSGSGKTRLIERLILELKARGRRVAALKHCPHGFDFDAKAKDSRRFFEAGADGVAMVSPRETAVVRKREEECNLLLMAEKEFPEAEFVLIEGGKGIKGVRKVEIMNGGRRAKAITDPAELIALVSAAPLKSRKPVFHPDSIAEIADFLEKNAPGTGSEVALEVDGMSVRLKDFVRKFIKNTVLGIVGSLHGVKENPRCINLSIRRRGDEDEKQ